MSASSSSLSHAAPSERRGSPRRRVLKASRLTTPSGHPASSATLRDLSETGARLSVPNVLVVPHNFRMTVEIDGMTANCEIVWRKPGMIGVRFLARPTYKTPLRRQVIQAPPSNPPPRT